MKLILCLALMFSTTFLIAQTDTTRPQPTDLVIFQVSQVDYLLKKIQRLEEDLIEIRNALNSIALQGWQRPQPVTQRPQPPKKEGKKE